MHQSLPPAISRTRIILFGSEGGFTRAMLKQLLQHGLCVAAVVMLDTCPENLPFPTAISQPLTSGGLAELATAHQINILRTRALDDGVFMRQLSALEGAILLVACFAQKLPARIWRAMKLPCWNLHPSLLPKYRGAAPLYWQIKNHEANTGLTLHEVTGRMDGGDVVARVAVTLPDRRDSVTLNNWVAEHGVKLFHQTLLRHLEGRLKPEPQDEAKANYFPTPQ